MMPGLHKMHDSSSESEPAWARIETQHRPTDRKIVPSEETTALRESISVAKYVILFGQRHPSNQFKC
jgi:hypothetical protein